MFLRSLFYERTVLSHLEKVRQLPPEAQAEIAMRVSNFIELARPVSDDLLSRFVQVAREEQQQALEQGARSDTDPLWAAPAISEAWCNARLGLAARNLTRHSAIQIISAIEAFTIKEPRSVSIGFDWRRALLDQPALARRHSQNELPTISSQSLERGPRVA
jgi:hypothetical protein